MIIRFLGVHNEESDSTRLSSVLIDEVIAVDAGSLTCELSFAEQEKIKAILISHSHYDHIRAIPAFAFSNDHRVTKVFGTKSNLDIINSHLLDGVIYPELSIEDNFLKRSVLEMCPVEEFSSFNVEGYRVTPLPMPHLIETVGYLIVDSSSSDENAVLYATDTGPGISKLWPHVTPRVIIIDTTFPNRLEKMASDAKHLCPSMLAKELIQFQDVHDYLPRVILIHRSPRFEDEIRTEVQKVGNKLGIDIEMPGEGTAIKVE